MAEVTRTGLTLQDHHEIGQLFACYGRLVDGGDADGYCALFTEDGSFARTNAILANTGSGLPPAEFRGRAALHALVLDLASQFLGRMRHQLTDLEILPGDRPDEARAVCYGLITDWRQGPGILSMHGTYRVTLVRTDAGWRFRDVRLERLPV